MNYAADEIVVVNRFEDNFDVLLEKPRLYKVSCFFGERYNDGMDGLSFFKLESRASDSRDHQSNVIEVGQQECSNRRTISHMFNHSFDRFSTEFINQTTRILHGPLDIANMFRRWSSRPFPLARRLSRVL